MSALKDTDDRIRRLGQSARLLYINSIGIRLQDGILRLLREAVHMSRCIHLENVKGFADSTL